MGSMIELALGRLEVDWGKNSHFADHGQLFQDSDLKQVPYYYASDDWPDGEPHIEYKEGFGKKLLLVKERLELLGYTTAFARYEYDFLHRLYELDKRPVPFEDLAKALETVNVSEVSADYGEDHDPGKFVRRELLDRLSEHSEVDIRGLRADHWEIDMLLENLSPYSGLRLLAENNENLDLDVCWSFSDVVEGGWAESSDFRPGSPSEKRFLLVTEGSSDAKIIAHAMKLLRPHIADFFQFVDMSDGYPFSGTGELFKFMKGLIGIGVQNRTLVIYDNDAEGVAKFTKSSELSVPENMGVIKLPNRTELECIKTIGPSGESEEDINGRAASIECYLDLHYGRRDDPVIRWTSFNKEADTYQGEIEGKTHLMKQFLDLRELPSGYNTDSMEACLNCIISECIKISERLNISGLAK